jgi:hypothetical protein
MQLIILLTLFATAMAVPADMIARAGVCSGDLFSYPLCCLSDVLGIACLDGEARK